MRSSTALVLLFATALPCAAQNVADGVQNPASGNALNTVTLPPSIARAYVQTLAEKKLLPAPRSQTERAESTAVLDEIVIYGQVDPEDYVRRRSKFLAFRDRMAGERPMTPKERTQALLCLIGLCGRYGPDGLPYEPTAAQRNEARTQASTTQLNSMFRGTLQ
jgi:hypothetical protein